MQKHSGTIQKRKFGTDDRAEQFCWKPWQQWCGSCPMPRNHDQDRNWRAVRSEPSDAGLGCPTRYLSANTALSEELGQDSALFAVWTRVPGRDRTLRGNCSTKSVRHKASCSRDGRKAFSSDSASSRESTSSVLMLVERSAGMFQVDAGAATRSGGWSGVLRGRSRRQLHLSL